MSRHRKRLAAPGTWNIKRKNSMFITEPFPGNRSSLGLALSVLLKDIMDFANTNREIKVIINSSNIRIDGKVRKDPKFPVGIFDTVELAGLNQYFRVTLNSKGKISLVKINKEEIDVKPCKITGKTETKGKTQLNLFDGRNILVGKGEYKVGDTLLLSLPNQAINKHLRLDKKSMIFLIGGKHIGEMGAVEDIVKNKIIYKDKDGELIETSKQYAFVIGEDKPVITIT